MPFLFVIPSEAKESRIKIATADCQSRPPAGRLACHNRHFVVQTCQMRSSRWQC